MNTTIVKRDKHSIYVRCDGRYFRPVITQEGWPINGTEKEENSLHKEGDRVKARHIACTPMAKVGDEYWFSHGECTWWESNELKKARSEECWRPE